MKKYWSNDILKQAINEIVNSEDIYLRCLDNSEMDEAYQELVLNFKNGLGE